MLFHVAATTNTRYKYNPDTTGFILPSSVPHTAENATGKKEMKRGHYGRSPGKSTANFSLRMENFSGHARMFP